MVWVTNTWQCCQYSQLEWTSEVDERMISNHQPADIALKNMLWLFGICTVEGWLPQDPFQSWVSYFKIDHYVEWFRPKKTIKFVVVSVSIICWGQSLPKIKHFCALQPLQAAWIRSTPPVSTLAEAAIWAVATGKTKGSNVVKANAIPLSFGDGLDTCRPPISGLSLSMVAALGLPFTAI